VSTEEKLNRLHEVLTNNWSLPQDTDPDMDRFLAALTDRVRHLLDKNMNRLTTAMYTLDINEELFSTAMQQHDRESQSASIAQLILNREQQKMESLMQYEQMKRQEQASDPTPKIE
jgi:hypothetical protein